MFRLFAMLTLVIAATAGCEEESPRVQPPEPAPPTAPTTPAPRADLSIDSILVHPQQPRAGAPFTITVYVKNVGEDPSGPYDLVIKFTKVSQEMETLAVERKEPLGTGNVKHVWFSETHGIELRKEPGFYQVYADIRPVGFADTNEQNNHDGMQFQVVP